MYRIANCVGSVIRISGAVILAAMTTVPGSAQDIDWDAVIKADQQKKRHEAEQTEASRDRLREALSSRTFGRTTFTSDRLNQQIWDPEPARLPSRIDFRVPAALLLIVVFLGTLWAARTVILRVIEGCVVALGVGCVRSVRSGKAAARRITHLINERTK